MGHDPAEANDPPMKRLLVIHHSQSGGTAAIAESVLAGARDPSIEQVEVDARSPFAADADAVRAADGYILCTPENFGYMSGALKDFFDRIYYPCLERTQGRPYALVVKAGNDGRGTVAAVERIVTGLRWRAVQAPLVVVGAVGDAALAAAHELGMTVAAGIEAGLF